MGVTRRGYEMTPRLREAVVRVLARHMDDGMTLKEMAAKAGMSSWTFRNYMVPEVINEAGRLRERPLAAFADEVDRAMVAKAMGGNVAAARLVYARLALARDKGEALPTLDELIAAVDDLKARRALQVSENGGNPAGETGEPLPAG